MGSGTDEGNSHDTPIVGPPRWVKVFALIGLVVFALFLLMLLRGHAGPGRHF